MVMVVVVIKTKEYGGTMEGEYLTVAQIAQKTNIPETTVRRYLKLFETFFKSKTYGRTKKYQSDATEVISIIGQMYEDSKSTSEIRERLQSTVLQIIDVEKPEHVPVTINATSDIAILLEAQEMIVEAFREEIEEMRKSYSADNEKMLKEITSLQAEIIALRESQRQEKDRKEPVEGVSFFQKIINFFKAR